MLGEKLTDEKCGFCGVEVRPETAFCFNCGKPVAQLSAETIEDESYLEAIPKPEGRSEAALANLAEKLDRDREEGEKLAKAAAERKRSRSEKKTRKIEVWAEPENESIGPAVVATVGILILSLLVIFLMVWIK